MVVHIKDPYTDRRIRLLAARLGVGLTEAIKEAVDEKIARDERGATKAERLADLKQRLQPMFDRVRKMSRTGDHADKRFYDEIWGQENDD